MAFWYVFAMPLSLSVCLSVCADLRAVGEAGSTLDRSPAVDLLQTPLLHVHVSFQKQALWGAGNVSFWIKPRVCVLPQWVVLVMD